MIDRYPGGAMTQERGDRKGNLHPQCAREHTTATTPHHAARPPAAVNALADRGRRRRNGKARASSKSKGKARASKSKGKSRAKQSPKRPARMRMQPAAKRRSSDRLQSTLSDYVETEAAANDNDEEDEDDANASDVDEHGNISNLIASEAEDSDASFVLPSDDG